MNENLFMQGFDWQSIFMQQAKIYFAELEKNYALLFNSKTPADVQQEEMKSWLENLNKQWQQPENLNESLLRYWDFLHQIMHQASDKMFAEWRNRLATNQPINSAKDLFALWLQYCQELYTKSLSAKEFQIVFADILNAYIKK